MDVPTSSLPMNMNLDLKLKLLKDVARGLASLHLGGIIHGDIKPANVLLSCDHPPRAILSDFGLSSMRENVFSETLVATAHFKGTPKYSAPELLGNPYDGEMDSVPKTSFKTDVYAFAIMAWEVLVGKPPFQDCPTIVILCTRVHRGHRPSLLDLPTDCPPSVKDMIECCWSEDIRKRKTAFECWSVLKNLMNDSQRFLSGSVLPVGILYHPSQSSTAGKVCNHLCYHEIQAHQIPCDEMLNDSKGLFTPSFTVLLLILSQTISRDTDLLEALKRLTDVHPRPLVYVVHTDPHLQDWVHGEMSYLCRLESSGAISFYYPDSHHEILSIDETTALGDIIKSVKLHGLRT
jgi:serine/threonine protein kinase